MDDQLKLGLFLFAAGYLLLYAGGKIKISYDTAKIVGVSGVFGAFTGSMILLFFGLGTLLPGLECYPFIVQFFFWIVTITGAAAPIWWLLKKIQFEEPK